MRATEDDFLDISEELEGRLAVGVEKVFDAVWRYYFSAPGCCALGLGRAVGSHELRSLIALTEAGTNPLGGLHKAEILNPDESERRVVDSMILAAGRMRSTRAACGRSSPPMRSARSPTAEGRPPTKTGRVDAPFRPPPIAHGPAAGA